MYSKMEVKFKRDTSFRKQFFTPESFSHPAKMDSHLLLWIVEHYTAPGETILDPMAGMGTTMLACTLGRNVVLVELEEKFCNMCKSNWEKVSAMPQLGYDMGQCNIIQGDARQLEELLVDKCIFSPPYAENIDKRKDQTQFQKSDKGWRGLTARKYGYKEVGSGDEPNNIGNLPYGQIDKIVTSPPYEGSDVSQTHMTSDKRGDPGDPNYRPSWKRKLAEGYAESKRPYHEVDSIITSPPYDEGTGHGRGRSTELQETKGLHLHGAGSYSETKDNIGELKGNSYLEAMLQVYRQCHKVLKPQGLMILVAKNFIRDKQVVRLDKDTIKLCEQAGFSFLERHYRKLPSQSFWRIIYHQKYPKVEKIEHEDVLVFRK